MNMIGHKFQSELGSIPMLAAKNTNPIITNTIGQKTRLGMISPLSVLKAELLLDIWYLNQVVSDK